jgi:hypothetical protein
MATTRNCTRPPARPIVLSELVARTAWAATGTPSTPATGTPSTLTFPQVRAKLANAAHDHFTHDELCARLRAAGVTPVLSASRRALAMRYAWALLPGGMERAKGGR